MNNLKEQIEDLAYNNSRKVLSVVIKAATEELAAQGFSVRSDDFLRAMLMNNYSDIKEVQVAATLDKLSTAVIVAKPKQRKAKEVV